jgi:tetratricopeptide (TPR) repeat protein
LGATGKKDECVTIATKAIDVDPSKPTAYYTRGLGHYGTRKFREALRDFNQAIELGMTTADAYYHRAAARDATDDWLGAIIDYSRAIELAPNDWRKYRGRAIARRSYGDYLGSIEDYNKVLELAPAERGEILNRSWARLFNNDVAGAYQDAIDFLGEGSVASATEPFPVIVGYIALRKMGKPEAARTFVQGALKSRMGEPYIYLLQFLAGEITSEKLLELAKNTEWFLTDAHGLIGTKYLLDGDRRNATIHFKWDQENGSHGSHERILHQLARTEYARMTGDPRLLTPPLPAKKP